MTRPSLTSLLSLAALLFAAELVACGDEGGAAPADTGATDVADTSAPADTVEADTTPADTVEVPTRVYRSRAIGGMSMGAMAITIALKNPDTFDIVGALGGYADTTYLMSHMLRLQLAGFCPLEQLEGRGEALNDANASPPVDCGPAPAHFELEVPQSFNRLRYDTNGITMTRGFYADVIGNFSSAYGNLSAPAHPDSPLYPAGVDLDWIRDTPAGERCASPRPVTGPARFNLEYNPDGAHPVIPLCDQDRPDAEGFLPSWFDPGKANRVPIQPLLAVDLNDNGRRDLGEPVLLNAWERFDDVGPDGCPDALEDGLGGCTQVARPVALGDDPNGDDFHWRDNPDGLEGNDAWDAGEPFRDLGLDGLDQNATGFADSGEGNGEWDAVAAFDALVANDADTLLRSLTPEQLDGMDFWFDAGIRDVLHASVGTRHLVAALTSKGRDVTVYGGFAGREGTMFPTATAESLFGVIFDADLSAEAIGRDVYVEYGDPNASQSQIDLGDGKHVGRDIDALNRLGTFIMATLRRLPDPDLEPDQELRHAASIDSHFYSEALGGRRSFTLGLPPGYKSPENADRTYPTLYFLHGLGQDARDLAPATAALAILMSDGRIPKAILVFPDGGCCFVDTETGQRECACSVRDDDGNRACVDPACTGPADSCEVRPIPDSRLTRECHKGSLYTNLRTNRWGEPRDDLGYQDSVMELVRHVDATYRTRSGPAAGMR